MPKIVGQVLVMNMDSYGFFGFGYLLSNGFGSFQFFGGDYTLWKLHGLFFQVTLAHPIPQDGFGGSGFQKKFLMMSNKKKLHID